MTTSVTLPAANNPVAAAQDRWLRVLCVLFFISGIPALIYQLVWQRALFRIFGVNIESVTVIVTAFMLGLGLGSLAGGWLSSRRKLPLLLLLACIELLTAVFGVFSLDIFEQVGRLVLGWSLPAIAVLTLVLVIVPTLLMGATLPLLVGHLVLRSGNVGNSVGLLYYVNTLGAGAACLFGAVALFPWFGMNASVGIAAAINFAVSLAAVMAHVLMGRAPASRSVPPPMRTASTSRAPKSIVLLLSGLGGLVCLSYEIFFFRIMSFASGSASIAFAATLGALLVGLASAARASADACKKDNATALARRVVRSLVIASLLGGLMLPAMRHAAWLDRGVLGVGLLLVYLLARHWGVLLPCLAHLAVRADERAGMQTAHLYLANIAGSALGSVLTGFVLMNHLSLVQTAQALVVVGLLSAAAFATSFGVFRLVDRPRAATVTLAMLAAVALLPAGSERVLEALQRKSAREAGEPFSHVVENRSGIITVERSDTVFGNGAYDGHYNIDLIHDSNGIVRPFALSLFHAAPKHVLMIGFASGSWAQVIANHPQVESLVIVEINPGYRELAEKMPAVASVLRNPKVTLVVDDGRRWLLRHPQMRFDAVVANTTYHFRAHATNLLSVEFLENVKAHLKPGGIAFYNTTDSSRVQRTGCRVFDHGARFTNHMVLSASPIDWNFDRWRDTLERYRIDGRPVVDASSERDRKFVDLLMQVRTHLASKRSADTDIIETCPEVLERTAGQPLVTDDNMGTEWRYPFVDR